MTENKKNLLKKRVLKKLGQIGLTVISSSFILANSTGAVGIEAAEAAKEVVVSEGAKEVLNQALKIARSTPSMSVATGIVCIACVPAAGMALSPGMCIACGILIAKTLG